MVGPHFAAIDFFYLGLFLIKILVFSFTYYRLMVWLRPLPVALGIVYY